LRPSLSIYQGSSVGPVLPHELTFYAVRLSKFVKFPLGTDEAVERPARDAAGR